MVVFAKVIGAIAVFNKHGCTALLDVIIEAVVPSYSHPWLLQCCVTLKLGRCLLYKD